LPSTSDLLRLKASGENYDYQTAFTNRWTVHSGSDAEATLKRLSDDSVAKTIEPWISVTEHTAEHYGLLVAYYRAKALVPPETRPK
jgi:hypothetical protein